MVGPRPKAVFSKPPLPLNEQVALLLKRGMIIDKPDEAAEFLGEVNYYRFSGYALYFEGFENQERTHVFKAGTRFEDVRRLYEFDSALRSLFFDAIEPVEIAFRTAVCLESSLYYNNSHWYQDQTIFTERFNYKKFLSFCKDEVAGSRELFIESYLAHYSAPALPPGWMLTEILTLGKWSLMYASLKERILRKHISDRFDCSERELKSWMHGITFLRNLCAHHSRLWNRSFPIRVLIRNDWDNVLSRPDRAGVFIPLLFHLHNQLSGDSRIEGKLRSLKTSFPEIDLDQIGLMAESPLFN